MYKIKSFHTHLPPSWHYLHPSFLSPKECYYEPQKVTTANRKITNGYYQCISVKKSRPNKYQGTSTTGARPWISDEYQSTSPDRFLLILNGAEIFLRGACLINQSPKENPWMTIARFPRIVHIADLLCGYYPGKLFIVMRISGYQWTKCIPLNSQLVENTSPRSSLCCHDREPLQTCPSKQDLRVDCELNKTHVRDLCVQYVVPDLVGLTVLPSFDSFFGLTVLPSFDSFLDFRLNCTAWVSKLRLPNMRVPSDLQ